MKMVKSLLLGSAAGLVAVTAGQAADLPVKARPVQYVKVCSLYGAGFYYMPGTDMCIKIGGWVRAEVSWGINGNSTTGLSTSDYNNRYTNNFWTRERGYITADAREQTAYGVARGYIAVGIASQNNGQRGAALRSSARTAPSCSGRASRPVCRCRSSTSTRQPRCSTAPATCRRKIPATAAGGCGAIPPSSAAASRPLCRPKSVVTARSSTSAARLARSAASQRRAPTAPSSAALPTPPATAAGSRPTSSAICVSTRPGAVRRSWVPCTRTMPATTARFRSPAIPAMRGVGSWAVGLKINTPFITPGDYFVGEVNYTEGATKYLWNATAGRQRQSRQWRDTRLMASAATASSAARLRPAMRHGCQLTTAWGVDVAYEHYWTPQWHQSLVFNGMWNKYGKGTGSANSMLCVGEGLGAGAGTTAVAAAGCNNNWDIWGVGSRLQWDVTKSFYIGVEAIYQQFDSAQTGLAGMR